MAINLATKYSKYVDEQFDKESFLTGAVNTNVDFSGVNEVSVYAFDDMDMNDYTRSGTARYGTITEIGDRVQTFTIDKDRSWTGSIDEGNAQDQYNLKQAGARLKNQMTNVVTPEIEEHVLKQWAYGAGKVVGGSAPTKSTLLGLIQTGVAYMNNNHVPKTKRRIYIAESYGMMLPQLTELTYLDTFAKDAIAENKMPRVAGCSVVSVPDTLMPDNVYFIIQHKDACPFAKKLSTYRIHKDPLGINGNVIEGRVRYWADVLGNKANAVYVYANTSYVQAAPTVVESPDGTVTITAAGATIYYTTDGTDPRYSKTRTLIVSGGTLSITEDCTVKAYGYTSTKYPSTVTSTAVDIA